MIEAARRVAKLPRMTHSDPTRGMQSYPGRSGAAAVGIPRTRASWAVVPVIAGLLLGLPGLLALNWASGHPLAGSADIYAMGIEQGVVTDNFGARVMLAYLRFGGLVLHLLLAAYLLAWTGGAVRGRRSAWAILGMPGHGIARGKLAGANSAMVIAGIVVLFAHCSVVWKLVGGELSEVNAGAWLTMAGTALMTVGGGIGPRVLTASAPKAYPA